jgi:hypothetical protein
VEAEKMTLIKASEDELEMLVQAVRDVANEQPEQIDRHGEYFITGWDEDADEVRPVRDEAGDPKPGCIIGRAVWSLRGRTIGGIEIVEAFISLNNDVSVSGVIEPADDTERASDLQFFLTEVQENQDRAKPWREAIRAADVELRIRRSREGW